MSNFFKTVILCFSVVMAVSSCGNSGKSSAEGNAEIKPTYTVNGVSFNMKEVPGTSFAMGYTLTYGKVVNAAVHQVIMDGYAIGEEPVTRALWKAVMGKDPGDVKGEGLPVTSVTRKDCLKFLKKLSHMTGVSFRLPTEAEWEYAVRKSYASGAGKVFEHCADYYEAGYSVDLDKNPSGPVKGDEYVVRIPRERDGIASYAKSDKMGFRIAASTGKPFEERLYDVLSGEDGTREKSFGKTESFTVKGESFKMIAVKGGTFKMGATVEQSDYADADEKPVREIAVSDFGIGQTEVTAGLWKAVMGYLPRGNDDLRKPVVNVSWYDAQMFVASLDSLTGRIFRLPSEAEWEYASRGGAKSHGYKFSGSDMIGSVAVYDSRPVAEVKSKAPNELGLYDMSGNAWEWCLDKYRPYGKPSEGETAGNGERVNRGGSAKSDWRACRVSNRSHLPAGSVKTSFGFRLAI
ncbi:MAG: SUMF1/EgtB/PvdO family nonheme iron enzyme [Bacteroidales bacterium]|jgi:formylglycine-generating enzyme required for sulfatase activity|nr:SUMF1/EgtB/PvdO family nonheme iron enzyme [Bacteroidales bacterium]